MKATVLLWRPPGALELTRCFAAIAVLSGIFPITPIMAAQLKFETASVKRAKECAVQNTIDPGMVALHGDPLNVILAEAFAVKMDQIAGPSWLGSDCFSIDAKIPEGATKDQTPAMLQALLAERFKLVAHKESRLKPGYALVVGKQGPKLKESDPSSNVVHAGQVMFGVGPGSSQIKGAMTTGRLASFLSGRLGAPVEDLTGLKGKYDIDISWIPDRSTEKMGSYGREYAAEHPELDNNNAASPTGVSDDLFGCLRHTLGLRLDPRKEPVEVLVIDHIEQIPTEN